MKNCELQFYNDMILSLKRGNGTEGNKSNAKPLFLLAIFDCISMQWMKENRFLCDDSHLTSAYKALLRHYNEECISAITVPYYHLRSSSFYHLKWKGDFIPPKGLRSPSGKYLREHLEYAHFDDELWTLLQNAEHREFLRRNIINRFLSK